MTARRSVLLQLLALALAIAMSAAALPFLKGPSPVHWNLHGRPDAWGSPAPTLLFGPAILAGVVAASFALARKQGSFARDLYAVLALVAAFFVTEHGILLGATLLKGFLSIRLLLAMVFLLFAGLAPVMARVDQNPWIGVRTPWTLGSGRVWRATHRATARLWLFGGLFGALATFVAPFGLLFLYLLILALGPVAISYRVWRKMGRP